MKFYLINGAPGVMYSLENNSNGEKQNRKETKLILFFSILVFVSADEDS